MDESQILQETFYSGSPLKANSLNDIADAINAISARVSELESIVKNSSGSSSSTQDPTYSYEIRWFGAQEGETYGRPIHNYEGFVYTFIMKRFDYDVQRYTTVEVVNTSSAVSSWISKVNNALEKYSKAERVSGMSVEYKELGSDGNFGSATSMFARHFTPQSADTPANGDNINNDEVVKFNYVPVTGDGGWNSGLDIDEDGIVNNPLTEFEVYAKYKQSGEGSLFRELIDNAKTMTNPNSPRSNKLTLRIPDAIQGKFICSFNGADAIEKTTTGGFTAAPDNILSDGVTVLRGEQWDQILNAIKALAPANVSASNASNANVSPIVCGDISNVFKLKDCYRLYVSNPDFYPSTEYTRRCLKKAFYRLPDGFTETTSESEGKWLYYLQNGDFPNIKLRDGDVLVYFRKNKTFIDTTIRLDCFIDGKIPAADIGGGFPTWQFPAMLPELMRQLNFNSDWISYSQVTIRTLDGNGGITVNQHSIRSV